MATLGPNDLKQLALPSYWDAATLEQRRLESGETYAQFVNDVTMGLALANASIMRDPIVASLAAETQEDAIEYGVGVTNGFQLHTEYAVPDPGRGATTGHMIPLLPYDRGMGWTWDALRKARRTKLDEDVRVAIDDVLNLYKQKSLYRVFKSTYDAVGASGRSMPVADGGTADANYVPRNQPDRASAFAATHTHLGCLNGITQANLETTVAHIWEHGFDAPFDLLVAQADVASWTDQTAITGFVPADQGLIRYGQDTDIAIAGAGYLGVVETDMGPVRLRTNARIPTKYWCVYKSFGASDPRNPLVIRTNPMYGLGAVLLAGDHIREFPLENAIMFAEFGVAIRDRVQIALVENSDDGAYTDPTIS